MFAARFYRELPHIYDIAYFGDHLNAKLPVRGTLEPSFGSSQ
jgi:hypothetical protein